MKNMENRDAIRLFIRFLKEHNAYSAYIQNVIIDSDITFSLTKVRKEKFLSSAFRWDEKCNFYDCKFWVRLDMEWEELCEDMKDLNKRL